MNCYLCQDEPGPGGTDLEVRTAAGICKGCGIGLCRRHGQRSAQTGLLLCPGCRRAELETVGKERQAVATRSA